MSNNLPAAPPIYDIVERLRNQKLNNPITKLAKRMDESTDVVFVICDISGSMLSYVGNSDKTKLEMMKDALTDIMNNHPKVRALAFSDTIREIQRSQVQALKSYGGTNLTGALEYVAQSKPRKTIVISDGEPNDAASAKQVADSMTGQIDIVYCGPETNRTAIDFMEELAKMTGGRRVKWDMETKSEIDGSLIVAGLLPPGV